jgi:hypothetical protein
MQKLSSVGKFHVRPSGQCGRRIENSVLLFPSPRKANVGGNNAASIEKGSYRANVRSTAASTPTQL